jgi:hypothetical protein
VYKQHGFSVSLGLTDGEFDMPGIRESLAGEGVALDSTGCDEHVGDIECYVQTVKERMHATYNTLPFTHMPPHLVIKMAKQAVFWLHSFPRVDGVSDHMSLREIMTGQRLDYARHCRFEYGEYVQTHKQHDSSMTPCTIGALALWPTGNVQGTWYFMSLSTGRVLKQNHATQLPMPHEVIDTVHWMARQQKANPGLVFADRNNVLDDSNDDSDDESYEDSDSDDDDWSQPSGLDEDDHGNYMPPNDGDTGSTDDDPDDPVDDNLADEPSDDESIGDFDIHADDDDDTEPAPEDQGVVNDYSTPTMEEAGVTDDDADDPKLITEESGVPDGEVEPSVDDPSEGTASAEDQGVSDKASVQDADEMDARYG